MHTCKRCYGNTGETVTTLPVMPRKAELRRGNESSVVKTCRWLRLAQADKREKAQSERKCRGDKQRAEEACCAPKFMSHLESRMWRYTLLWVCEHIYIYTYTHIYTYIHIQFSSVQSLSHVRLFATPWTTAHQASLSITNSWRPPKPMPIKSVMPSNHLILCRPLLLLPSIFNSVRVFSNESLFASGGQSIGVSASTSVLPMNTQDWSPLGWTSWISFSPRDSQESSPTPQFKSINSSVLSFLYSPTLTSIYDHWKNHTLD